MCNASKAKPSLLKIFGCVLFAITVLACTGWMIYRFYTINGWESWDMEFTRERYSSIAREEFPITLIIVSLFAGSIPEGKKGRIISLAICYIYVLTVLWITPLIWSFATRDYALTNAITDIISFCSLFSAIILPSFFVSSFLAFCVRKLIGLTKKVFKRA
jgi:hypothetical protein